MPDIPYAHYNVPAQQGGTIDFILFFVEMNDYSESTLNGVWRELTFIAGRDLNLHIDQSALVYTQNRQEKLYGDEKLVQHFSRAHIPRPNGTMRISS